MSAKTAGTESLREYLATLEPGPIADKERLLGVLRPAWSALDGCYDHAMREHKLSRLESPCWEPPHLYFDIERHGGTVLGSARAEVQSWCVDVESETADACYRGTRQVSKAAPRWDAKAAAGVLAAAIRAGTDDPCMGRTAAGDAKVLTAKILPIGCKQTTEARRRRFYDALDAELSPEYLRTRNVYSGVLMTLTDHDREHGPRPVKVKASE